MKDLTPRQREVFELVTEWLEAKGYPPTQTEIRDSLPVRSVNAVRTHLSLIEKKGYLRLIPGQARGIQVTRHLSEQAYEIDGIPLVGHIAAGTPVMAEQNIEDVLPVAPAMFGHGEMFALTVEGDSMVNAGIVNGDRAVIRRQPEVENGQIAAVLIGEEATLKYVHRSCQSVRLKAANPSFEDMVFQPSDDNYPKILGLYKGIIRIS